MGTRHSGKSGWLQFLRKFDSSDGAQKAHLAPGLLDLMNGEEVIPHEALRVIGETALELRRHNGLEATFSFLDSVEKACPELAPGLEMSFALMRVENALAVGESALAVALKAVERWEESPLDFLKLVECMAWHGSPELQGILMKFVKSRSDMWDEEDLDDDIDDDDEADIADDTDDEDDDDFDDDDFDEIDDDGDADEDEEDFDEEELDDDEISLVGLVELFMESARARATEWVERAALHLLAVEVQRVGHTRIFSTFAMHGNREAGSELADLLDRMGGRPVESLVEGEYLSRNEELLDVLYDFARYLREHHEWSAPRAFLGANALIETLEECNREVPDSDDDQAKSWWFLKNKDAVETLKELLEQDHPHRAAALAAALTIWPEFLQCVGVLTPKKAKLRITSLKNAFDRHSISERILQRVA